MANNVVFQDTTLATPLASTTVETKDQGAGVQRQVVELGSIGATAAGTALTASVTGTVTAIQGTGTNLHTVVDSGSVTVVQATAANLNVTAAFAAGSTTIVTQATAANLNATITGSISNTSFIATQATAANLNVTAALAAASTVTVTQATGANLHVAVDSAAAKNYLWYTGATAGVGTLTQVFPVMTTELNALTNAGVIVSSVSGTSGLFTNTQTAQAIWSEVFYINGTQPATAAAGGNITGWFLQTPDAGTTVESKTVVAARPPDFLIPITATAATAQVYKASGPVRLPAVQFFVLVQNNVGVTLSTSGGSIKIAPVAVQY